MGNDTTFQGDGFVLRRWRASDLDALVRHADDAQVSRGLSARFPYPYTRAAGEAFLAGQVLDLRNPVFAIEIDGEACGSIGSHPIDGEPAQVAMLGYWLGRKHWGRGLMTEVVRGYVPWVIAELALQRLVAVALVDNPASARVLLKNGFREGPLRRMVDRGGCMRDMRTFSTIGIDPDR